MANPFVARFTEEDMEVRTRVRNLFWTLVVFGGAMAALGFLSALRGTVQLPALAFSIAAIFGVALELLRRGKYKTSANLAFVVLVVGSVVGVLTNRIGDLENDFFRLAAIFAMTTALTSFFGYHGVMALIMGGAGLVTMGIIVLTPYPADQLTKTLADLNKTADPVSVTIVFLMTVGISSLGLFQSARVLARTKQSHKITEEGFADVQRVFAETQEGLAVSHQMEETARELQKDAKSILDELSLLEAQTANLLHQASDAGRSSSVLGEVQNSLRDKMEVQVGSIHQTSSALEQINALFKTIATSSRTKKESLDALGTQAREGERKIQQMAGAFAAMQRTAQDVLSVVQVIEDISSRTNLLAMNASIEAAHAGNSGRGFSVVASEIRKLAEETGRNSQAIRQTLDTNLAQVQNAVQASAESQTLLATMIQAFQDIQTLLSEQMNGMDEMGQGTQDILHSVEQLQTGTGIVQEAAQSLQGAVVTNSHQAISVKQSAEVLSEGVRMLQAVALAIGSTAETIRHYGSRNHEQVQGLRQSLERVSSEMAARKTGLA